MIFQNNLAKNKGYCEQLNKMEKEYAHAKRKMGSEKIYAKLDGN